MSEKPFEQSYVEHMEMISKALENLAKRISIVEGVMAKLPEPGANMIKYKPAVSYTHLRAHET